MWLDIREEARVLLAVFVGAIFYLMSVTVLVSLEVACVLGRAWRLHQNIVHVETSWHRFERIQNIMLERLRFKYTSANNFGRLLIC